MFQKLLDPDAGAASFLAATLPTRATDGDASGAICAIGAFFWYMLRRMLATPGMVICCPPTLSGWSAAHAYCSGNTRTASARLCWWSTSILRASSLTSST